MLRICSICITYCNFPNNACIFASREMFHGGYWPMNAHDDLWIHTDAGQVRDEDTNERIEVFSMSRADMRTIAASALTTCILSCASALVPVIHSIPLEWNFNDGLNGWAQSTAMEMGVEVDAMNGFLRGFMLPASKMAQAFVDSPELRVEVDPDERDHLVMRMKYLGQCERAMISLERNTKETAVDPGSYHEPRTLRDPVNIPFQPRASSLDHDLYFFPIWKHMSGTIHRVRLYPCTKISSAATRGSAVPWSGHSFRIDWVAFAKAPVITKVRGCIDKYFTTGSSTASMNCTERIRRTNGFHANSNFECSASELPIASTYNCLREGGQRITIHGKHFGPSDAIVTIDGEECTDVVHLVPEVALECTLPPTSMQWLGNPHYPSSVRVYNGRLHNLNDDVPLLSYVAPVRALSSPAISNVAAHAIDVNWRPPGDVWDSMTITGYLVEWKLCSETTFDPRNAVVVGNVTSTTIIELAGGSEYHARVTTLSEDYRQPEAWQTIDLYGRRAMLTSAVFGLASPLSACVKTLTADVTFTQFTAQSLTNVSAVVGLLTTPTLGPTGEIGDQGHFGLYVNGHANIQNCNATSTCCDGYATAAQDQKAAVAACTYVCSVTESRTATFLNGHTNRSVATNAQSVLPTPAKVVRTAADISGAYIAPVRAACGPALRLSASAAFLTGSAWYPRQMNVQEGFESTFIFRIANPSTNCKNMDDVNTRCRSRGGDGFAFVVQNDVDIALGSGGMELGYGGIGNALAIEFDSWFNTEQLDAYENHISIHVSQKNSPVHGNHTFSLGSTSNIPDLTDGEHIVRITYEPNIDENMLFGEYFSASTLVGDFLNRGDWISGLGMLSVHMDNLNTPALVVPLRLEASIELNHGRAWVGFTAATGETAYQTHDILSWSFSSLRRDVASTPPTQSEAP